MGLIRPSERRESPAAAHRGLRRGTVRRLPWEIRFLVVGSIYGTVLGSLALAAAFVYFTTIIPDPMALRARERAPIVRVLAREGSLLAERGSVAEYAPIDLLPEHLLHAVVATEDRRFYAHWGVDPQGLIRAALTNLRTGRYTEGGSTITQQLAKNLFLSYKRTVRRKLEELVLALWLELRLTKREILELYLNRVYFGGGAYGVEAAAQRFFAKSAQKLTLAESAVLAGLLKAPSRFSPAANPTVARARARTVLAKMVKARLLSSQAALAALSADVTFAEARREQAGADYVLDAALERLSQIPGAETGEVIVETTIDAELQRRAQGLVSTVLAAEGRSAGASQAGLIVMDMGGGIRALVGGRSHAESQFNRALKARRQPGSAFKPFVYLAAVESGMTADSVVQDLPILGSGWSPRNEDGRYRGAVTLREGLAQSINTVAVRLNMSVGPRRTAAVARRLGIRSPLREDASLGLGTSEVTLAELTGAYGVFANGGKSLEPHLVTRVRTSAGKVLYERATGSPKQLVAPGHVAEINGMLNAALVSGTGRRASLPGHPAAGKTGTSQGFRDAWFIGYTGHLVGGVWVGNDEGLPMNRVMGGSLPARLWRDVMTSAHAGRVALPLAGTTMASLRLSPAGAQSADQRIRTTPRERYPGGFINHASVSE